MTDATVSHLLSRLLKANAPEARAIWREAGEQGLGEELRMRLASGVRTAPRHLSDEC